MTANLSDPGAGEVDPSGPVEVYGYDRSRATATRRLTDRFGRVHVSTVAAPQATVTSLSPADAYESAWLRLRDRVPEPAGPNVTVADLFSGCGGLSVGVSEACRALGMTAEHVLAADVDPHALAVYEANFAGAELHQEPIQLLVDGDVGEALTRTERRLSSAFAGLVLAVGGPPCQGNSDLNNHTRRADPKNALYSRMVRFAEVVRPRHLLIENVPGVVHDKQQVVQRAVATLRSLGYRVSTAVIATAEIGVPQARRRHLLLATLDESSVADTALLTRRYGSATRPVMWAISDLADTDTVRAGVFDTSATHSESNRARIDFLFDRDLYDLPDALRPDCHRLKPHTYKAVYGRMHPDRPAPTITSGFGSTGQGRFVHPFLRRTLTPHEAARLQGFPDNFSFAAAPGRRALQQMIGNAVHSRLGYAATADLLR